MKKTYITPATDQLDLKAENLMEQVQATSVTDGQQTESIETNTDENAWAGAKGHNAWNTWDEEEE